jgi:outer membrane lipoprotein-sorting protein
MVSIRSHLAKGRVAASRQSAANFLFPSKECGALPRRRYGVLKMPPNLILFPTVEIKSKSKITRLAGCSIAVLCLAAVCRADERDVQFNRWFAAQTNLQSWSADFIQTRSLKVLSQPLVATGKVWVTVPGLFRWELGQPAQTIVLRQPNQLLIIYPRLKRVEKYSLEGVPPGPLKDALALMDASLPRDRASMEERFRLLSATETNSILQMTLQPKSASARKFIGEILIGFRTNDFSIAVTELKFADGSSLRNDFTNTVLNRPIDPALFEVKLAPDFTVVEPLRQ